MPHEYEMFSSPSFNIVRTVWMLLEEHKALKVWPISICVRGIERVLETVPLFTVNSGSLLEGQTC